MAIKQAMSWAFIIGVALLFVFSVLVPSMGGAADDYSAYVREQARAEQIAREAALAAAWAPWWAAVWNLAGTILVLGLVLAAVAAAGVAVWRFFRGAELVTPDQAGRLPVLRRDLAATGPAALDAYHASQHAAAARPAVPHSLTYAPREDYRASGTIGSSPALLPADVAPVAPGLPPVTDLADIHHTPTVHSILLGLGEGGAPVTVPMKSLWHIALAGPTGNGKSNIARLVVAQLQSLGAKVCVGDPKWTAYDAEQDEDWRPIADRLHRDPAYSAKDIGALLAWGTAEMQQRLALRRAQQKVGSPLFIYLDELPWIAANVKDAEQHIGELVRVGRGVGLFLLVGAQDMLARSVNLSAERDNFRTGFYLGGDRKTGSVLLGLPQREIMEPEGVGVAWLRSAATTPPELVRVPYASNRAVYQLLGDGSEARMDIGKPSGSLMVAAPAQASGASVSFEASRALLLFQQGYDIAQIVKEVTGVQASEGRRYQTESARVQGLIRDAMRGER